MANNGGISLGIMRLTNWALIAVIIGIIMELAGPTQGWLKRIVDQYTGGNQAAEAPPDPVPVDVPEPEPVPENNADSNGVFSPGIAKEDTAAPQKSDLEKQYDALVETIRAKLPPPVIGNSYNIYLRDGQKITGTLTTADPSAIKVKLDYGDMTLPVHQLAMRSLRTFFPERTAKLMALHELKKVVREQRLAQEQAARAAQAAIAQTAPADADAEPGEVVEPEPAVAAAAPLEVSGTLAYKPIPAKSDPALLPTLKQFAMWMEVQHRRVGGKIADKVYAKFQNGRPVLYLIMNPTFLLQDHNTQFQLAEGLWQFWGFRCQGSGLIGDPTHAHLVMLNSKGRIIGGSREGSSSDLWFEQSRKKLTAER